MNQASPVALIVMVGKFVRRILKKSGFYLLDLMNIFLREIYILFAA